jgi:pimeloyl-ACP methyl ester carboxylesterase
MSTHRTAKTEDQVNIAFEMVGEGPTIILVHGLGDDRTSWRAITECLRGAYCCVTLDLRGHGASTGAVDFDPFLLHRDLEAVIAELHAVRPMLVGHSLGAIAVSTYAARHDVLGVVNIDQPLELSGFGRYVRALAPALQQGPAHAVAWQVLQEVGFGELAASELERLRSTCRQLHDPVVRGLWRPLLENSESDNEANMTAAIRGIRAPYLALHGAEPGEDYPAWLKARVPNSRVEIWPDARHFLHLARPERFAARLVAFLTNDCLSAPEP